MIQARPSLPLLVDAAQIDAALTFPVLMAALERAFASPPVTPVRHHHHVARPDGDATLLLMPAWDGPKADAPVMGVKVVSVFPGNALRSLPSVQGSYLLMDGATGELRAVMDGSRLTLWRTAAASALAARHMARPDARTLLMVGAGALAPFLIRAHASVRPLSRLLLWARRPEAATDLAASLRPDPSLSGCDIRVVEDLAAAVPEADIVSCATLASTPLLHGEWLRPGCHVDLVGAFTRAMREADSRALARSRVFIDTPAALTEGGDVAVAIAEGSYAVESVVGSLSDLVHGTVLARQSETDITLFKSVGTALEDLAAAAAVAQALGVCRAI